MSYIVDFAGTSSSFKVIDGFDLAEAEGSESIKPSFDTERAIVDGTAERLVEGTTSFDFIADEMANGDSIGDMEGTAIVGDMDANIIEGSDGSEILVGTSGEDNFLLEFFHEGVDTIKSFDVEQDKIIIQGVSADASVTYDEISGKLTVEGQDIAQLDTRLDFGDDNYEIF